MKSNSPFRKNKCDWAAWEADRMKSKSLTKDTGPGTVEGAKEIKEKGEYYCDNGTIKLRPLKGDAPMTDEEIKSSKTPLEKKKCNKRK